MLVDAAKRISDSGGTASAFAVDIGDDAQVAALAAHVDAQYGRCEILINNAAISDGTGIEKMTMARYHEVIRVNQDGAVRVCLAFVPLLKKAGDGRRILNIASIMGVRGWQWSPGTSGYAFPIPHLNQTMIEQSGDSEHVRALRHGIQIYKRYCCYVSNFATGKVDPKSVDVQSFVGVCRLSDSQCASHSLFLETPFVEFGGGMSR